MDSGLLATLGPGMTIRTKGYAMKRLLLAALLTAFGLASASADTIKIALPVLSLESLPIFIAQDKGFFGKHGVEVDVVASRGGGEAMKAYISGDVQIVGTGFPEVGLMRERGVDVELYFAQTSGVPFALLARKDLGIKSVADLKGKDIAVTSPGSLTANITRYLVKQQGMNPDKDVGLISVGGGGEILGALQGKKVAAAMLFEPFVTVAVMNNVADILVDVGASLDAFSSAPLAISKAFLQKSPKQADGLHAALLEGLDFLHKDKAGTLELAQKKFPGMKPEVIKAALDRMDKLFSRDGKFTRANIEHTQQISKELGIIKASYPYEDVVAPSARE
jgi:NitT/TauT family transport system substrate-binding protein